VSPDGSAPDLIFVELIHQALRADGARLRDAVAALEPRARESRLVGLREYYDRYREQLVAHHTHEDELFFPALTTRVGESAMHLDELVSQHHQLDGVLHEVGGGLAALADPERDFAADRAAVVGALSTMVEELNTHLDLEEKTALPLIVANVPAAEYKQLESKVRKATPRAQAGFMVPWMAENASPEQRKAWFRSAPPLRMVYLLNRRRYRQLAAVLAPAA
jgi:hemerythrin-like domain-containing protein